MAFNEVQFLRVLMLNVREKRFSGQDHWGFGFPSASKEAPGKEADPPGYQMKRYE
jgi:hypothetical protein